MRTEKAHLRLLLPFVCLSHFILSQKLNREKAEKFFEKGLRYYHYSDDSKAIEHFLQALKYDSTYTDALIVLGDIYYEHDSFLIASNYYLKARNHASLKAGTTYRLLHSLYLSGNYEMANKILKETSDSLFQNSTMMEKFKFLKESINFAWQSFKNPLKIQIQNAGENINTQFDEYFPSISLDGKTLIFTRRIKNNEDFYITHFDGSGWEPARPLGPPVNTVFNEGAQAYSPDGSFLLFTRCNFPQGYGSCDIWISMYNGREWEKPVLLPPPLNTENWESQPAIAPDNSTIYFVSNRKEGKGKGDIWRAKINIHELTVTGLYCLPVNTPQHEMSPFIHPDNTTLYFSSDGYPGMGRLDIFLTRIYGDSCSPPVNLGYPVNTEKDDNSFIVFPDGITAMIASSREGGYGGLDLYFMQLPEHLRPLPVIVITGRVTSQDGTPLRAEIEIYGHSDTVPYSTAITGMNGEFKIAMPFKEEVNAVISAPYHLPQVRSLYLQQNQTVVERNFILRRIEEGALLRLSMVNFDFNSSVLNKTATIELDKIFKLMRESPEIEIIIEGHTDSIGTSQYNQWLSEERAKAVADYLVGKGIESRRIRWIGYGSSRPLLPNTSEENRAINRRTEIRIIRAGH